MLENTEVRVTRPESGGDDAGEIFQVRILWVLHKMQKRVLKGGQRV